MAERLAFEEIIEVLKGMNYGELQTILNIIPSFIKARHHEYHQRIYKPGRIVCPYCDKNIIERYGKTRGGYQRYRCLNYKCHKTFSDITNSFLYKHHRLKDYFHLILEYTLDGLSVRKIASKLAINHSTIWIWRTKILSAIHQLIDHQTALSKEIYADETFIKINLKGIKPHHMPRASYPRKLPVCAHRELVCIQTAIDTHKNILFRIDGHTRTNVAKLDKTLKSHIAPNSLLVTDGERAYQEFTLANDILHEPVIPPAKKSRNGYSLGMINSLHSNFKNFLHKYKGVSTRRLDGYIDLFLLNLKLNQIFDEKEKITYLYDSLIKFEPIISTRNLFKIDFPIPIKAIYDKLIEEKLVHPHPENQHKK